MTEHNDKHKFVLPPEYDETDSRWTLKYREPTPGLVELMEHSNVYVNAEKLAECKTLSNDCVSLARRLLNEIFTASALSVCSVPGAKPSHLDNCHTELSPQLDSHAMIILLKFVTEYGQQRDWKVTDYAFIQNHIQRKLEVTRYVRFNCVEDENDTETVKRKRLNVYKPILKHPFPSAGLVELIEHSDVYVDADKLAEIKELSNDCVSLAQKLIREVFSKKALRECLWSRKTTKIFGELPRSPYVTTACLIGTDELEAHAEIILLHFVDEYGLKMGWPILDFQFIREILAYNIQKEAEEIYFEFLRNRKNSSTHNNKRKFVQLAEYDETDSRWTLKYRKPAPGLVELMEHSDVYVNAEKLAECKTLSNDCVSLARRLLNEIFTASALSVCSVPGVKPSHINNCDTDIRSQLDSHAMIILLKFVTEYGQQKDWKVTDYEFIQNHIQRKLEVTRYVRFNCVEDENDTETVKRKRLDDYRETLKHPFPSAELVELVEHSDVYVDADKLAEIKDLSNDCVSLAQRLIREVFSKEALRECPWSRKSSKIFGELPTSRYVTTTCLIGAYKLEAHAEFILLHFVDEYGLKMGWPILDFQFIREILAHDIQKEAKEICIDFLRNRKNNNKCKFILPPEFDKTDSRWTLKYREPAPGLVELMEHSDVYVNAVKLAEFKTLSKHYISLALRLLNEIFTASALSVCSVPGATPSRADKDSIYRPQLDSHSMIILLKFVTEYGGQKDWKVKDYPFIQRCIQRKLEQSRDTLRPLK